MVADGLLARRMSREGVTSLAVCSSQFQSPEVAVGQHGLDILWGSKSVRSNDGK